VRRNVLYHLCIYEKKKQRRLNKEKSGESSGIVMKSNGISMAAAA